MHVSRTFRYFLMIPLIFSAACKEQLDNRIPIGSTFSGKYSIQLSDIPGMVGGSGGTINLNISSSGKTDSTTKITYMCRMAASNLMTAAPWVVCDGLDGSQPKFVMQASSDQGTRVLEVEVRNGKEVLANARRAIYKHASLNGLAMCPQVGKSEDYFKSAASVLNTSKKFGEATNLANPFIKIQFDPTSGSTSAVDILTLRKGLRMNDEKTLILLERKFPKRSSNTCEKIRVSKIADITCDAIVVNAKGEWACFKGGAKSTNVSNLGNHANFRWDLKRNRTGAAYNKRVGPFANAYSKTAGSDPWHPYLPD